MALSNVTMRQVREPTPTDHSDGLEHCGYLVLGAQDMGEITTNENRGKEGWDCFLVDGGDGKVDEFVTNVRYAYVRSIVRN